MPAFVKFWGTRGLIPTPANWTRVHGGNTPCVEVRFGDAVFVCDAGSGIRELGKDLMGRTPRPKELHLLITHAHWDHVHGFPFFAPAYETDTLIRVYGTEKGDYSQFELLSGQLSYPNFPIPFHDLKARLELDYVTPEGREIAGVVIRSFPLRHMGGSHGFAFEKEGRKIVYATDNDLVITPEQKSSDTGQMAALRAAPRELVEAVRRADLLIMDAQFDDAQAEARKSQGHASCLSVTDLALQAGVKNLALFHHDPESTDRELDARVKSCRERVRRHGSQLVVFAAREGVELKF